MESFRRFVAATPVEKLADDGRYLFLSDLHMGDGGPRDDLEPNRILVETALEKHYLEKGFTLVVNGDAEDLNKFRLKVVRSAWKKLYRIFDAFHARGRLRKIVGNHDLGLLRETDYPYPLLHGLVLERNGKRIFAFHGHQASRFFVKFDYLAEFIVRYLAKPLRIKNSSIATDSRRRFMAERLIYRAARRLGILAITGHTHRPLFESLSKYDSLRWSVEDLLREYSLGDADRRARIAELIGVYRRELERLSRKETRRNLSRSIYGESPLLVPCLFNSGCATGRHGFTALEIEGGSISLVHWSAAGKNRPYIEREAIHKDPIENGAFTRYVLKSDNLDQTFARIELLS
ncbi:MAG: hypothetical protein A2001_06615 [Treponema sp. GWC1_61_84]|nr:MAG: hypothetical protein A2001_06615 [Treponema sp. GWC1_61_84]